MTRARDAKASSSSTSGATSGATAPARRRGRPPGTGAPKQKSTSIRGSAEARQKAYVIVETLSGLRSPSDASALIGVTINRYYQLEWRALQGLVEALEARPAGRQPSPEAEAKKLERERDRLARELRRAQALVRVAQRAVGLPAPQAPRDATGDGKKRRRRGPRNRTARTLARLRTPEPPAPGDAPADAPATPAAT
ncbi:MAG: hypothetical protein M9894_15780 [Planctomycetes bacterium]|nr:hypothetical protein [Planctomycetota bacterium]MCO5167805.1 hypothetical protein [Planctomycetota bacterium]